MTLLPPARGPIAAVRGRAANYLSCGFLIAAVFIATVAYAADIQVLTQHNDPQRTGANLSESILTPRNVGSPDFVELGRYKVEGQVFAQPLFTSSGGEHRLYVATAHNFVYAFDADKPGTGPVWTYDAGSQHAALAARVYAPNPGNRNIFPEVGILGTPVIDLAHSTIYFVAMTQPDQTRDVFFSTLHAVDIRTGKVRSTVNGTVRITGNIEGGGTFNPGRQSQRAALALMGDRIYVAWAGFGDIQPYDGLVMSFDIFDGPTPMKKRDQFQVVRFNPLLGKRHRGGGIWHSGGGPAIDEHGEFLYVVTGNGDSENTHAGKDFDSSDVKLDRGLHVIDYYTPSYQNFLNENDLDLSVSGPMIPPEWVNQRGQPVRRVLHGSKAGILYNLDRDAMGRFFEHENRVQQVSVFHEPNPGDQQDKNHIHSTPVFWQTKSDRRVYVASDWSLGIKAFRFNDDGILDPAPLLKSIPESIPWHKTAFTQLSLSANGVSDGVIWGIACVDCVGDNLPKTNPAGKQAILLAYDAERLGAPIYTSPQIAIYPRFNAPTIANGRVYVPTFGESEKEGKGEVVVFGLTSINMTPISYYLGEPDGSINMTPINYYLGEPDGLNMTPLYYYLLQ